MPEVDGIFAEKGEFVLGLGNLHIERNANNLRTQGCIRITCAVVAPCGTLRQQVIVDMHRDIVVTAKRHRESQPIFIVSINRNAESPAGTVHSQLHQQTMILEIFHIIAYTHQGTETNRRAQVLYTVGSLRPRIKHIVAGIAHRKETERANHHTEINAPFGASEVSAAESRDAFTDKDAAVPQVITMRETPAGQIQMIWPLRIIESRRPMVQISTDAEALDAIIVIVTDQGALGIKGR